MTPPATAGERRTGGPVARFTREKIIDRLKRYADLYGPDFTAAAFSPSTAKWRDEPQETIDRYYLGDPETGEPWPSLNAIKTPFGGFNAARAAAGLPPNKPGQRRRAPGEHAPVRDVSHAESTRTIFVPSTAKDGDLEKARARIDKLERQLAEARAAKPATKTIVREKTKTVRVPDASATARLRARVERLEVKLAEKTTEARDARSDATRLASRLERAEAATAAALAKGEEAVSDAAQAARDLRKAEDALTASERLLAAERAREPRVERKVVEVGTGSEQAIAEAERERAARDDAERRAAKAEREYRELAATVAGEPRRLTEDEMAALRADGPAGPQMLGRALTDLAAARKANSPTRLRVVLGQVAGAAIAWRDRL